MFLFKYSNNPNIKSYIFVANVNQGTRYVKIYVPEVLNVHVNGSRK